MSSSLGWEDKPVKYLRDRVVDQLKYNYSQNHLELDEFEQLVRTALSTQSKSELMSLIADLPTKEIAVVKSHEGKLMAPEDHESMTNILSASKKRGIWIPPKQLKVLTVLGEAEIDFREAQLGSGLTYISLVCWLGSVKIIVPPEVNVVSNIKNILGDVDSCSQGRMAPDASTIVIEGKVVLGEVKIKVEE